MLYFFFHRVLRAPLRCSHRVSCSSLPSFSFLLSLFLLFLTCLLALSTSFLLFHLAPPHRCLFDLSQPVSSIARRLPFLSLSRLIISYSYRSAESDRTSILGLLFILARVRTAELLFLRLPLPSQSLIANLLTSPFHPFPIPPSAEVET